MGSGGWEVGASGQGATGAGMEVGGSGNTPAHARRGCVCLLLPLHTPCPHALSALAPFPHLCLLSLISFWTFMPLFHPRSRSRPPPLHCPVPCPGSLPARTCLPHPPHPHPPSPPAGVLLHCLPTPPPVLRTGPSTSSLCHSPQVLHTIYHCTHRIHFCSHCTFWFCLTKVWRFGNDCLPLPSTLRLKAIQHLLPQPVSCNVPRIYRYHTVPRFPPSCSDLRS